MAKKTKKKRVRVKSNNPLAQVRADALKALAENKTPAAKALEADDNPPRCLVVKRGKVGKYAKELVGDLRLVMSPYTPVNLKEKKSNVIKDFIAISPILGLSHLMTISQSENGPNLGIARLTRGPSLSFRVLGFTPSSLLRRTSKKLAGSNFKDSYLSPPLVVLNNFDETKIQPHVKIIAITFQAMFPAINVKTVKLGQCRRVVLVNYNEEEDSVDIRHYFIKADPQGTSRSIRKLLKSKIPDLSHREDVSEIIDPGVRFGDGETSDSEVEDANASVSLPQNFPGKGNQAGRRSVVKLREIGPRLNLQLIKVEEGVFTGEVQYHKFHKKTEEEVNAQRARVVEKERLAEERRKVQEENVEKKRKAEQEKLEQKRQRLEARKNRIVNRAKSYDGAEALLDNQFKHNQDETGADNREEEEDADIESDIDEEEVD